MTDGQRDSSEPQVPATSLIDLCFTVGTPKYETYRGVMGLVALCKLRVGT